MKQKLINYLHKHLLNTVTLDDVITIDKNVLKINGETVTQETLRALQAEEKALTNSALWKIMTGSVRHIAKDKIFNKATQFSDVTYGKAMLFCLDTIESIGQVIKNRP